MLITKNFKQLDKEDVQIAGGKGASLGEMTKAGILVPGGFVVLSGVFDEFLKKTDLNVEIDAELNKVDTRKLHTVEGASEKIQGLIMNAEMSSGIAKEIKKGFKKLDSKFVAVRSSATSEDGVSAAWAGQLDSFLNTTENKLLNNIKRCWASLFTPRAIFYRFEQKLNKDFISVAVVVQKMVDSEKSGVAFSVHPVTEDYNQLIIEAGFGLGEAIVSGSITPDSYVVNKKEKKIIDININNQTKALYKKSKGGNEWRELKEKGKRQVLSKKEIIELSRLIMKIENHYGFPCDIEWTQEKGKFYIVQSRPITTLRKKKRKQKCKRNDYFFIRKRFIPVVWPVYTFWRRVYKDLGIHTGKIFNVYDKGEYTGILSASFIKEVSEKLFSKLEESVDHFPKFREESTKSGEALIRFCKKNAIEIRNKSIEEVIDFYNRVDLLCDDLYMKNVVYWVACEGKALPQLMKELRHLDKELQEKILRILMLPNYDTYSNIEEKEFYNLVKLARENSIDSKGLDEAIERFSEKYVWFTFEYAGPKLYDFEAVKTRIKEELKSKQKYSKKMTSDNLDKENLIKKYNLSHDVVSLSKIISNLAILQDDRKRFNSEACYWVNGIILNELSDRLKIPIDLLKYLDKELLVKYGKDVKKIKEELRRRSDFLVIEQEDGKANFISGQEGRSYLLEKGVKYKVAIDSLVTKFKGQVAYSGLVKGRVKILKHSGEVKNFSQDILVTSMTTPDFVPHIKKAKAIITDEGGITSHASIISRELKKPCIIGTKVATQILKDGDLVEVDADKGVVKILKKNK
jgi:phosphohistidine swiveling domain-containing protein